eukprot:TRINITY_DN293_c0_g1_i1.p1 TRINITY_DN293_c0_g1~~TRINITY_DN293_c0_g1_i1.p1  ORF type:complete len:290 (+),score=100.43 TRINITY_DN293_c0_g1_i1:111-980(+)
MLQFISLFSACFGNNDDVIGIDTYIEDEEDTIDIENNEENVDEKIKEENNNNNNKNLNKKKRKNNKNNKNNNNEKNNNDMIMIFSEILSEFQDAIDNFSEETVLDFVENKLTTLCSMLPMEVFFGTVMLLFNVERRERAKKDKKTVKEFIKSLCSSLTDEEQEEISKMIVDLPISCFGNEETQEQTRIFVNIFSDTKLSQSIEKKKIKKIKLSSSSNFTSDNIIENLGGVLKQLSVMMSNEQSLQLFSLLVDFVDAKKRTQLVLQQLILSHIVPESYEDREIIVVDLFN